MSTKKRWHGIRDLEREFGPMTVGLFLRAFREAAETSQTAFAKTLGLSRANLCDIEKGRKTLSLDRAAKLAAALGVPETILIKLAIRESLKRAKLRYDVELKRAS